MVFSSIEFLFYFLPAFLVVFVVSGARKSVVVFASLVFYAWGEAFYVLFLLASIAINHRLGLLIERGHLDGRARLWLIVGVAANLLPLIGFKYLNFIVEIVTGLLNVSVKRRGILNLAMPLGISFFTFHALSYLVDVYRRHVPAERSLRDLTLYISMFPQLIAGPIIRYKMIAPELHNPVVTPERSALGIRLFVIGLAQKVLIANTVAVPADEIFALGADRLTTPLAWLGIVAYTLQIYFDFGGYSLMAIGLGLIIGFTFPRNFNYPYAARSITDFWRRWHITLSSWFRDYLYIPLGGNRGSMAETYRNLLIVFLLCGLWHGAAWTFVVWGLLHGMLLIVERVGLGRILERLPAIVAHAYVLAAVMVTWVFFRATSLDGALSYVGAMLGFGSTSPSAPPMIRFLGADVVIALAVGAVASMPIAPRLRFWLDQAEKAPAAPATYWGAEAASLAGLVVLAALSVISIAGGAYNPFIYFRF